MLSHIVQHVLKVLPSFKRILLDACCKVVHIPDHKQCSCSNATASVHAAVIVFMSQHSVHAVILFLLRIENTQHVLDTQ